MNKNKSWRRAKEHETLVPSSGDWGGPLCCVVAKYEDGTEIVFDPHILNAGQAEGQKEGLMASEIEIYQKKHPTVEISLAKRGNYLTDLHTGCGSLPMLLTEIIQAVKEGKK